jgi:hypothetical protein
MTYSRLNSLKMRLLGGMHELAYKVEGIGEIKTGVSKKYQFAYK